MMLQSHKATKECVKCFGGKHPHRCWLCDVRAEMWLVRRRGWASRIVVEDRPLPRTLDNTLDNIMNVRVEGWPLVPSAPLEDYGVRVQPDVSRIHRPCCVT